LVEQVEARLWRPVVALAGTVGAEEVAVAVVVVTIAVTIAVGVGLVGAAALGSTTPLEALDELVASANEVSAMSANEEDVAIVAAVMLVGGVTVVVADGELDAPPAIHRWDSIPIPMAPTVATPRQTAPITTPIHRWRGLCAMPALPAKALAVGTVAFCIGC
jgi:hypothetical protein